ncbi:MAG: acyl-CoA dehydrogenase [Alphaproteobacteria bacterium]|jgi:(2S)-methylsuccinyl-CoA dehydrogenase|nr:acyl-CoA dehydrogenase [Alphaproteobacteria bacterium]
MATQLRDIQPEPGLLEQCATAVAACDAYFAAARERVGEAVSANGMDAEQYAAHGLAWTKVYVESLREMQAWGARLDDAGGFGETERLILEAAFAEYLSRLAGGLPMSQGEVIRPHDLYVDDNALHAFISDPAVSRLTRTGWTAEKKRRLAELIEDGRFGDWGLEDDSLEMIRDQFRRFSDEVVKPDAQKWHEKDELIPLEVIRQVAELGVFGLTVDEDYGGLGMGKVAMCVVTEELSRGYIGVGSLGTRNEIAGELIQMGGTEEQKQKFLPKLASGEILPTAVFSEPNTGSDLASLTTRAVRDGDVWKVTGAKTWITHGARADLMTILCRTKPEEKGYKGLSMLLGEKTRGSDEHPFPDAGIDGGEIEVLGYRGMKEYTLSFDEFEVKGENLLGEEEGKGFKQLMATFEGARIQTAARAVGVAQDAMETALWYAKDRKQFGQSIYAFPRVYGKIAWMAVEIMIARQLTLYSAREKDAGRRCDLEAGLAKLIGAQVAWATADNALQVHGGNGYAIEYDISRVLCDSRILNIFEGAAEIQAQVIARRLLG